MLGACTILFSRSRSRNTATAPDKNQKPEQPGSTSSRGGKFLMQPMTTFNPDKLCIVHDKLNNVTLEWKP